MLDIFNRTGQERMSGCKMFKTLSPPVLYKSQSWFSFLLTTKEILIGQMNILASHLETETRTHPNSPS